jgi:hypothetical protein
VTWLRPLTVSLSKSQWKVSLHSLDFQATRTGKRQVQTLETSPRVKKKETRLTKVEMEPSGQLQQAEMITRR